MPTTIAWCTRSSPRSRFASSPKLTTTRTTTTTTMTMIACMRPRKGARSRSRTYTHARSRARAHTSHPPPPCTHTHTHTGAVLGKGQAAHDGLLDPVESAPTADGRRQRRSSATDAGLPRMQAFTWPRLQACNAGAAGRRLDPGPCRPVWNRRGGGRSPVGRRGRNVPNKPRSERSK